MICIKGGVCLSCNNKYGYELPQLFFDAGESIDITINLYKNNLEFDADGITATLKLIDFINRDSVLLSLDCSITKSENNKVGSIVAALRPNDTEDLFGKYIYQITLTDIGGDVEILKGNMILSRSYK